MNTHAEAASITLTAEQLGEYEDHGPTPPNGWSYAIGQRVDHVDGGWPATVVGRTATSRRGEFHSEMTWIELDETPEGTGNLRLMATDALVAI